MYRADITPTHDRPSTKYRMNLYSLLERTAECWPDRPAVYLGSESCQTWRQLQDRALRLSTTWSDGGGRVVIATENCPQYLEILFGTWAGAGAVVPLNYKLHPREMSQMIEDADPSLIFASDSLALSLRDTLPAPWSQRVVVIGSGHYEDIFSADPGAARACSPIDLAWLFYTSGTTGRSKGAMLSHHNLLAMTLAHLADVEAIDEGCRLIHAAPMSHGSGLYIPAYVARGAAQVIPASQGYDAEEFLDLCDTHQGCCAFLAPTMVQRLRLAAQARQHNPTGLRTIIYGGGPMYVEEMRKSLAVFGDVFIQIYGQGESPMTITWLRREDHDAQVPDILGSVGRARTNVEVRVVGPDGKDLPRGEIGEIVCRGDVVMEGYWKNPAATAQTLKKGWLYTGDMGSMDARGFLTLRDRSKDVVISGGSNIYPREVEEALLEHPGVAEVCVFGRPDEEWGEVVIAAVVCEPGFEMTAADLDAHCLDRIARFKRPKQYIFSASLPKSTYGKVLKRELRDRIVNQRSPA
jgi:acyl-CoA synthetase (AMP-forming)/AMP-acid ligase II